jgi:long-chain acyl-CoA synthetase
MERRSITAFLDDFLRNGDEQMYVQRHSYRTERFSYGQVAQIAFQFARELEARGVAKGDRVMLWGENSAEWVAVFFGCSLRGAIAVPMDNAAAPDFAARVHTQVAAKLLVCSREHAAHMAGATVMLFDELRQSLLKYKVDRYEAVAVERDDPLEIIFTSGTTAEPKGVVISHGNVLANITPLEEQIRGYLKYARWVHPVRFLNLLPLSHVFGQFLGMFVPPLLRGTVLFQESLNPSEIIETIRRERVSVLVAVPQMLQSLKHKVERDLENAAKLERFRKTYREAEGKHFARRWWIFRDIHRRFGWKFWAFISGGAALDQRTEEFWGRLSFAVIQGYGLTETTSLVSVNHPFRLGKGSIGKVLAGREVKLADDGEILVRGGGVASGYWKAGVLEKVGDAGWYHTGDIGSRDADGNLYFKGRKKDVLVTPGGMNIYPEDLENALRNQPEVRDCVVIGLDRGGNAEPCAVLITRNGTDAGVVVTRANESLAEYQRMREWFIWEESDFPRTSTGKPRVNLIREVVEGVRSVRSEKVPGPSPLAELMAKITNRTVPPLSPDAKLDDELNLSSLERVELLSALEDRYQVDLSETRYSDVQTVGELEKLVTAATVNGSSSTSQGGKASYHYPRWALTWPIRWIRLAAHYLLVRPAVMILGWPRIEGRENLRNENGPALVICNHVDDVDVGFVQTALPARFRHRLATATGGEALEALRTPPQNRHLFGRLYDRVQWTLGVALLNLFPLPRQAAFLKSFSYAGECIDRGYSVLVFPEGHHTTDGKLRSFRTGVGLLTSRLRVPVIPLRIDGLFEVKEAGKKFAPPGKIRIRIGMPVRFDPQVDPIQIAKELQEIVENLSDGPPAK